MHQSSLPSRELTESRQLMGVQVRKQMQASSDLGRSLVRLRSPVLSSTHGGSRRNHGVTVSAQSAPLPLYHFNCVPLMYTST
jgi:hypothetical protein